MIKFYFISKYQYNQLTQIDDNVLYFISDTKQIYKGKIPYTNSIIPITDISTTLDESKLYYNHNTNTISVYLNNQWDSLLLNSNISSNFDFITLLSSTFNITDNYINFNKNLSASDVYINASYLSVDDFSIDNLSANTLTTNKLSSLDVYINASYLSVDDFSTNTLDVSTLTANILSANIKNANFEYLKIIGSEVEISNLYTDILSINSLSNIKLNNTDLCSLFNNYLLLSGGEITGNISITEPPRSYNGTDVLRAKDIKNMIISTNDIPISVQDNGILSFSLLSSFEDLNNEYLSHNGGEISGKLKVTELEISNLTANNSNISAGDINIDNLSIDNAIISIGQFEIGNFITDTLSVNMLSSISANIDAGSISLDELYINKANISGGILDIEQLSVDNFNTISSLVIGNNNNVTITNANIKYINELTTITESWENLLKSTSNKFCFPDYNNGVEISNNYIIPNDGYLIGTMNANSGESRLATVTVSLDNQPIITYKVQSSPNYNVSAPKDNCAIFLPVEASMNISVYNSNCILNIKFYPIKQ